MYKLYWYLFKSPPPPHLFTVLLCLADLLSQGVHLLQERVHLLLFVSELTGQALFGGAKFRHPLRQIRELLNGHLPLGVRLLQLLCLTPETLQRVGQLLLGKGKMERRNRIRRV